MGTKTIKLRHARITLKGLANYATHQLGYAENEQNDANKIRFAFVLEYAQTALCEIGQFAAENDIVLN